MTYSQLNLFVKFIRQLKNYNHQIFHLTIQYCQTDPNRTGLSSLWRPREKPCNAIICNFEWAFDGWIAETVDNVSIDYKFNNENVQQGKTDE